MGNIISKLLNSALSDFHDCILIDVTDILDVSHRYRLQKLLLFGIWICFPLQVKKRGIVSIPGPSCF